MALTKADQERIRNRWQNQNSGSTTTAKGATSAGASLLSDNDRSRIQERWSKRFDVDDTYISTFISDANTFLNQVQAEYGRLESRPATSESSQDYYDSMRKTEDDLSNRAWRIKNFLNTRKGDIDEETYSSMSAFLDNFSSPGYSQVFHPNARYAAAYTGKTTSELDDIIAGLDDGEEKDWLTSYRGAVDYEEKSKYDLVAGAKEIEELEQAADAMATASNEYFSVMNNLGNFTPEQKEEIVTKYHVLVRQYGTPEELLDKLNKKRQYHTLAGRVQEGIKLAGVADSSSELYDPEFAQYAEYVDNGKPALIPFYGDVIYDIVNGNADAFELARGQKTISGDQFKRFDSASHMTEDEIALYNYYYNKHGLAAAEKYLDSVIDSLNARHGAEIFKPLENKPVLELVFSAAAGLDQFNSGVKNLFSTEDYIPTSATQYASGMVREDLKDVDLKYYNIKEGQWDDAKIFGNSLGQTMYDSGTTFFNMAPSILVSSLVGTVNPAAGAVVGNTLMGASAAGNAYQEVLNQGYGKAEARAYSTAVGVSESLLQYALGGIGNLGGVSSKLAKAVEGIDNALLRFSLQYGGKFASEALEEGLQEVLDPVFKNAILHTDEDVNWSEVAYSALLGGLSAGVFEGVPTAVNVASEQALKKKYAGKTDSLIQEGLQNDTGSESYQLAQQYKAKTDAGKTLTGAQIRNLLAANQEAITAKDMQKIQQAAEKRLTNLGETKNVAELAAIATKWATGQEITRSEKSILTHSQYGSRVANELLPENIASEGYSTEWAEEIGTESVNRDAYNKKQISQLLEQMASVEDPAEYKSLGDRVGSESSFKVSEGGQATDSKTGEGIDLSKAKVAEFVKDKDGKIVDMVIDVDGKQVKASEVDYADGNQSYLFEAVAKIENITPRTATSIIRDYDPASGQTAGEYLNGVDEAFTYGYYSYSEADMNAGKFAPQLTDTQRKTAYELGRRDRSMSDAGKADNFKRMRTAAEAQAEKAAAEGKEAPKAKNLTVTYDRGNGEVVSIDKAGIRDAKRSGAVEVAKILHKLVLGTKVEFFSSYLSKTMKDVDGNAVRVFLDENGAERTAPSGVYRKGDGTIRVDLNAYNGRGLTLKALSHELTHFIQQWSDAKYKVLADFLIKAYEKTDMTMHERVLREQARLEGIRKEAVSYDEAFDEVVANAMSKMLDDGKLVERLTELKAQDEKLARKLWQGFKKILAKFIGVYENAGPLFQDTADLMAMKETFEQLQNMFAEAMVEASENYQAALAVNESQTLAESSIGAGTQQSSQKTDFDKNFDYSDLNWATDLGIITAKDKAIFARTINNEIFRGAEPQSANGEYIIDTGKCLMFTDGDFHNPTLSRVIVFATEYESLTDEAKRRILYEAKSTGDVQASQRIIENLYGPGFAVEYTPKVHGANAGQNGRGKRANGKGSNQGHRAKSLKERLAEEGLSHLLEDNEAYSSQETDADTAEHPYSYNTLISKPDMVVTTVDGNVPKNRADVVYQAKQNAAKVGKFNSKTGSVSVYVEDVGVDVVLATNGLKHSLDRRFAVNAPVVLRAGEILHNSIRINEMTPKKGDASESYILVGTAHNENGDMYIVRSVINRFSNELASMDVLYAINAKKEPVALLPRLTENSAIRTDSSGNRPRSMRPGFQGPVTDSTISIADLLDLVNQYFPDILPEDVLRHYGYDARPEGDLGKDVLYSTQETDYSNRDMLANAFEGLSKSSVEYQMIQDYKEQIKVLNLLDEQLSDLNAEIHEIRFTKGKYDAEKLQKLEEKAERIARDINKQDKVLIRMEASEPLRKIIAFERKKAAQKTKEHIAEIQQNKKLRAEQAEYRHKIRNFKKKLESKLLRPTDRQYVPVDLIKAMVEVCEIIDTDTNLYNADGSINKAQVKRDETKEKLQNLKDEYEKLKTNSDPIYAGEFDEMVYTYLTELRDNFSGKSLKEMSLDELAEMYEILRSIDETLADARKLIGWGDAENVYEAGDAIVAEQNAIMKKRKHGKRNAAKKGFDKIDNLGLSPVRNVERMSAYNQDSALLKLFKKFEQGIRKKNKFKMDAYKSFEKLTSGKEYDDAMYKEVGGKKYTDVKGRQFGVSKMQMMQAILSWEREQANKNLHHIEKGGFTFADLGMLRKGNLKDAVSAENSHRVPSAVELVAEFKETLKDDKWCQDYMAAARSFFNGMAKDAINETSIELKHRIIAKDKSYIPFEVDTNFVNTEITDMNAVQQTINSYGMLKDTTNNAPQALYITGLNNILDRHIEQVGTIYGLAIEVRNFNKVWNVRSKDETGNNPTVKESIDTNWGKEGVKHIEQAVKDIQGSRVRERSALYDKVKSNYISSTFLLNLSVVTKQIGSLFSSTSMLRWRNPAKMIGNLIYTMANQKKISAEVDKYTATAWMRRQGMSDAELYTLMTQAKKPGLHRLMSKLPAVFNPTKWITAMDHAVALSLWRYAKQDTAKRTGLDGEALLKAAAEFYDEVVENTQSMTDVLHRPEIQKSGNVMHEAFAMFKTDIFQMAGQLQATVGRYMANKSKENAIALGRTVYSIAMGAIWGQLMTAVFALLRYKVDRYRDDEDEEKELTVESWMKRQGFGLAGDLMGYIFPIFGSEVVGIFESIMYGESDDFMDNISLTAINDLVDTMIMVGTSIKDGKLPDTAKMRRYAAKALQVFTPIPASNILRILDAIQLHAEDIANGEFLSFNAGVDSKADDLYDAIVSGNKTVHIELKSTYVDKDGNFDKDKYDTAVRTGLKKNDPRIHEAAQARIDGNTEEYKRIFREIKDERKFSFDDIMSAINSEESKIRKGTEPEKATSDYTAGGYVEAIAMGNAADAAAMKEDIIAAKVANGKTQEEAEKEFKTSVATSIGEAYSSGLLDDAQAEKMLMEYAGKDEEEAASKVSYWSFLDAHPEYEQYNLSESNVGDYLEFAEPAEIPMEVYVQYRDGIKGIAEIKDEWGDVEVTKREQVLEVIDSLPLTWQQKDALYLAARYSESKIWDVPW